MSQAIRDQMVQLMAEKDVMEKLLESLTMQIQILEETKNLHKNLVDAEGYPRQDLDFGELSVYRNLKRRRNQTNNDHVQLMKKIEAKMVELHEAFRIQSAAKPENEAAI